MEYPNVYKVIEDFAENLVAAVNKNLPRTKDVNGALRDSIRFEITEQDGQVNFKLFMLDYWKYVDKGRSKGAKQPPPDVILKWIEQKPIQIKTGQISKGGFAKKRPALEKEKKSLAFLIGRSIKRKGIKPTHFLSKEVKSPRITKLRSDIQKAYKQDIIDKIKERI